jgi:hypothetical protein
MRVVVVAAGDGTRWGGYKGTEKHLVGVGGERLLDRTTRQFAAYADVHVVGVDGRYQTDYSTLHVLEDVWPTGTDADKFLSSQHLWSETSPTVVAYGDVFFTDDAVEATVKQAAEPGWTLVSRLNGSQLTGTRWGECFAQVFTPDQIENHRNMLYKVAELRKSGELKRCGGWEHYRLMAGGDPKRHADYGMRVEVDDWTEDFDYPADYDEWTRRRRAAGFDA